MKKSDIYKINNHPKYKKYGRGHSRNYINNKSTGTLGFQEVGINNMSIDFITRPEFEEHQKHMDNRFDAIEDKMQLNNQILTNNIEEAVTNLKEEINDKKLTSNRFWIGISVPAVISISGILISIFI